MWRINFIIIIGPTGGIIWITISFVNLITIWKQPSLQNASNKIVNFQNLWTFRDVWIRLKYIFYQWLSMFRKLLGEAILLLQLDPTYRPNKKQTHIFKLSHWLYWLHLMRCVGRQTTLSSLSGQWTFWVRICDTHFSEICSDVIRERMVIVQTIIALRAPTFCILRHLDNNLYSHDWFQLTNILHSWRVSNFYVPTYSAIRLIRVQLLGCG